MSNVHLKFKPRGRAYEGPFLKILLVGPVAPPYGGIVRYCADIMESELTLKHEIVLFQDNIPTALRPRLQTAKNTWNIFKRDGFFNTLQVFRFVLKRMMDLERTLRKGDFDTIHLLSTGGLGFFRNTLHILIAKRHGVKSIFHLLGQIDDLYRNSGFFLRRIVSFFLDRADVHIVQSPMLAEFVRKITKSPVYSIVNGVKVRDITPPDGFAHSLGDRVRVITLGYLGYQKGTFDILNAAKRLKNDHPELEFVFVGGGEVEKFRHQAVDMGISDYTIFLGSVEDAVRIKLLQEADIFLLPSHAEGQPIALLEAMSAGLPVISSTVGSIPEVVMERNGFLIPPGDVELLQRYLSILAQDAELREKIGRHNALEAKDKFQVERVIDQINKIYRMFSKKERLITSNPV